MFYPQFHISPIILANLLRINDLTHALNNQRLPHVVLMEFERSAREVSAYASTSIEGNPLPLTEVKRILKSQPTHIRTSEQEVLNYNEALAWLNATIDKRPQIISKKHILDIHRRVMRNLLPKHEVGKYRQHPVVVNDPRSRTIAYLPPDHQDVDALMLELVEYVVQNAKHIHPIILAGIFHKQYVLIHPFMDGNGRTSRLLTKMLLARIGLNTFHLFSFENYYNTNVSKYFQMVGEVGNYYDLASSVDFTQWLEYFTDGIIDELLRVQKLLPRIEVGSSLSLYPHDILILEYVKKNGSITDREYKPLTKRAKPTRALDFKKLCVLGLLARHGAGRSTYYTFV